MRSRFLQDFLPFRDMEAITNLDLLWVGIAVAGAGTLGFSIYFSESKSATARAFFFFTIISIFWSLVNFASARTADPDILLWFIRFVIFFASWFVFALLIFSMQFPDSIFKIRRGTFIMLISWTSAVSIVTLTPLVYEAVTSVSPVVKTQVGPGIALFAITIFGYIATAIWNISRKFWKAEGETRDQFRFVLIGLSTTFIFLVIFEFIFPALLNDPTFVPYGGLFLLPFIMGTAYAILRYRLFNLRVAIFGLLVFLLATVTFFDVLLSGTLAQVLYRTVELVLILFAGVLLIKSMVREFELQRQLTDTNERQEGLIRFISHEVKGFLTKDSGAFAALLEGDFGTISDELKPFVERALKETRTGIDSVMNILKASNQKKGTTEYKKEPFDFAALAADAVEKSKATAEAKGLVLTLAVDPNGAPYTYTGDMREIGDHVLHNLIDNAINYTPSGFVTASLSKENGKIVFSVKDTGVGVDEEDKKRLFTEGGHGKESIKINVHSTGYGLFIAKNIVTVHGGTIHADSEGVGRGSTFVVEFPA